MSGTRLYVIPGSHPSIAAEMMLERKGVPFKRRDLITAAHKLILKSLGFERTTVPALKADGRKIQGTNEIARWLEEVKPEPSLFPTDPDARRRVEEAERWGDTELQPVPRRLSWYALGEDRSSIKAFLAGYKLGIPTSVAAATAAPIIWVEKKIWKANAQTARADLQRLPSLLDEVDRLVNEGVIGGDEPNVADYQIATSVRLLMLFDQLRPLIENRPAGKFALKVVPHMQGHVPASLPADWIPAAA
jgi:glutathione S-transferase